MAITEEVIQSYKAKVSDQVEGPDAVCEQMIRHWVEIMEDANPLYSDKEYAEASKYGGIIAPPTQVQVYTMAPIWPKQEEDKNNPMTTFVDRLAEEGFTSIVATEQSQEYFAPLKLGDRINNTISLDTVSPEKQTVRGPGHFVTFLFTYKNQRDEIVCKQTFTLLIYNSVT